MCFLLSLVWKYFHNFYEILKRIPVLLQMIVHDRFCKGPWTIFLWRLTDQQVLGHHGSSLLLQQSVSWASSIPTNQPLSITSCSLFKETVFSYCHRPDVNKQWSQLIGLNILWVNIDLIPQGQNRRIHLTCYVYQIMVFTNHYMVLLFTMKSIIAIIFLLMYGRLVGWSDF